VGLRICGYAFQNDGESYYRIKLFFLPDNNYYLSKNQGPGFTIFSKITTGEDGKTVFQNPVGFAKLMDHVALICSAISGFSISHVYESFPVGKAAVAAA